MEMTYTSTLKMPTNFAVVNAEEMMYLEAGGTIKVTFSRDFLRDAITAGSSFVFGAISGAIGTLGTPVAAAVCAAFGASYGWIWGGSVARSYITSDKTISVNIPLVKSRSYYIA